MNRNTAVKTGKTWITCALLALSLDAAALEPANGVAVTPLMRETASWDGTPIRYPPGRAQVTAVLVEIAPGARTGRHAHPVPNFGYVLEGTLEVTLDDGRVKQLKAGDALAEVVDRVHEGTNRGGTPAKLVVFYVGTVDSPVTVRRDE